MIHHRMIAVCLAVLAIILSSQDIAIGQIVGLRPSSKGDDTTTAEIKYGVWVDADDPDSNRSMQVMRLKVYPQAAPIPALKHRLIPDPNDRTDGNSAMFYLKAMGFIEQSNAFKQLREMEQKWAQQARDSGNVTADYPPYSWRDLPPSELPLDEVEDYLMLIGFQKSLLYDAARRKNYSQDRAMQRESNPIAYLLPEVQAMRQLARQQSVRLRYAVAQHRIDDAVEILSQIMTMANHVGRDEFLVSCLVGVAIEGIAIKQGLMLSQQSDVPNLYWAITACPDPMIDLSNAIVTERNFLPRQFPALARVDETVRPDAYWADFVEEILPQWNTLTKQMNTWGDRSLGSNVGKFQMAAYIASQYEGARKFLNEVSAIKSEQLDKYSATQTVFLAMVKYHAIVMDEATVGFYLPPWSTERPQAEAVQKRWRKELGWIADISEALVPATRQISSALTRTKQHLSLWQTVEAIRMTASGNDGKLPSSLDDFIVPAPLDPVSGRPFEYGADGQTATITGQRVSGLRWRLVVEIDEIKNGEKQMSKYPSKFLLFATCAIVVVLGTSQLLGQQADSPASIVDFHTTLVARVAPEALDALLYRTPEAEGASGETQLEKRLRGTKEVLDGQPLWVTADWPRIPTQVTICVGDPTGKKVTQLNKLWNVGERSPYSKIPYTVSFRAINDAALQTDNFTADRWKTKFTETFHNSKSPVGIAILPPRHLYDAYKELSIEIPAYLGGGPITVITDGALSATAALDPSTSSIDGYVESLDGGAAENLKTFLENARAVALKRLKKTADNPWLQALTTVVEKTNLSVDQNRVLFEYKLEGKAGSSSPIQQAMEAFTGPITLAIQTERLRVAALGMLNYESAYRHFPPQGKSKSTKVVGKGLSWRVRLLPFLGEAALFKEFKLDQPWDSPHNLKLLEKIPDIYRASHADDDRGLTTMVAPISEKTILGATKMTTFADIIDGSSNTILLVVVQDRLAVPWTSPQDYKFDPENPGAGLKLYGNKTPVAIADGTGQSANEENDWLNLFQMNDGEVVNLK